MEKVSKLRFRNMLDSLLDICDQVKNAQEKAIVFRIGTVVLNKLRIHVNLDLTLGYEVREFNARIKRCENGEQIVSVLWDDLLDMLELYRESLSSSLIVKQNVSKSS